MSDSHQPDDGRDDPRIVPTSEEVKGTGLRFLVMGGAIAALGIFAGFLWYGYSQSKDANDGLTPPTIKADAGPTKVKPDTPGGLDIPHQDKTVYNRMDVGAKDGEPKDLLAAPESPMSKPREPDVELLSKLFGDDATAAPPIPGEPGTQMPIVVDLLPPGPAKTKKAPAIPVPDAQQIKVTTPDPASGKFLLQVGAFRDKAGADAGWARMRKRHSDLLTKMEPDIARADLGAKGVFYRLRIGPLGDKTSADRLCDSLKKRKLGCLVVKP